MSIGINHFVQDTARKLNLKAEEICNEGVTGKMDSKLQFITNMGPDQLSVNEKTSVGNGLSSWHFFHDRNPLQVHIMKSNPSDIELSD